MNKLDQLRVALFLSPDQAQDLELRLQAAISENKDRVVGAWCTKTGFAVAVVVEGGRPIHWHLQGPFTLDQARQFFDLDSSPTAHCVTSDVRH